MSSAVVFKSVQHNIGVIVVGFIFALIGVGLDELFGFTYFSFPFSTILGLISLIIGFFIRLWATYYFYKYNLAVIVLHAQKKLITEGPFRFSRNPLYLGGNVFIFLGASLILGTLMGVLLTFLHLPLLDLMIRREEKQLEKKFGQKWIAYTKKVRRWI